MRDPIIFLLLIAILTQLYIISQQSKVVIQ